MSRFLRTLVKVGLVQLDPEEEARLQTPEARADAEAAGEGEEDVDRLLKETEALLGNTSPAPQAKAAPAWTPPPSKGAPPPPPVSRSAPAAAKAAPPPRPAPGAAPSGIEEGRALADIYADAAVPPSPFPAEKLNRLLEGLKAMDPSMRKAAVMAMDAADDAWSIMDPLQDAQRKVAALQRAKNQLAEVVGAGEAEAERELAAADAYQKEATEKIRAQIAELEALLQEELSEVANRKATSQSKLHATREAAAREAARLEAEISALNSILVAFAPPAAPRS